MLALHSNRHAVRGRFTLKDWKDDCERQVWNAVAASWTIGLVTVLSSLSYSGFKGSVQYRKWSPTENDPETANDPQNGPQMILDRKWSPKSTANDPERKIGMTWTQVSGSSYRFYYYYNKSDWKLNFTSQINIWIKTKWKKSFKRKNEVGRQHTTFTSC